MRIEKTPLRDRGFSLLELLLVLFLAPVVFMAVYSNFVTGVRLWQRLQRPVAEEDTAIFLSKARTDFRNMRRYAATPFSGDGQEVIFAGGVEALPVLGGERGLGTVRYSYDPAVHGIVRERADFSRVYERRDGEREVVLRGVRSFSVRYLVLEPPSSDYEWVEEYRPEKADSLPVAVRLSYEPDGSDRTTEHTFFIPAGGAVS